MYNIYIVNVSLKLSSSELKLKQTFHLCASTSVLLFAVGCIRNRRHLKFKHVALESAGMNNSQCK